MHSYTYIYIHIPTHIHTHALTHTHKRFLLDLSGPLGYMLLVADSRQEGFQGHRAAQEHPGIQATQALYLG